jgi:hypothetical protein
LHVATVAQSSFQLMTTPKGTPWRWSSRPAPPTYKNLEFRAVPEQGCMYRIGMTQMDYASDPSGGLSAGN